MVKLLKCLIILNYSLFASRTLSFGQLFAISTLFAGGLIEIRIRRLKTAGTAALTD